MKNLNKREKMLLAVLLIVGIGYLYYSFFLNPLLDKVSQTNSNIASYKMQQTQIQSLVAGKEQMDLAYAKAKDKLGIYIQKIPYQPKDAQIVFNMKRVASKSGILINNISLAEQPVNGSQTQIDQTVKTVPISLNFSASSYTKTMEFINNLEKAQRLVQISSISISKGGTAGKSSVIQASIAADYYYFTPTETQKLDYDFNNGKYGKAELFN